MTDKTPTPPAPGLTLWDMWGTTPPSQTKRVDTGGRSFTTISAYWQFHRATELFGPCGVGWGWTPPVWSIQFEGTDAPLLVVSLTVWIETGNGRAEAPLVNAQEMFMGKGDRRRVDDDVFKKLVTDTITKGLSYFGASSDVFLGLFDDNRYLAAAKAEEEKQRRTTAQKAEVTPGVPDAKALYAIGLKAYEALGFSEEEWRHVIGQRTGVATFKGASAQTLATFAALVTEVEAGVDTAFPPTEPPEVG
jgi:hypothetical protein